MKVTPKDFTILCTALDKIVKEIKEISQWEGVKNEAKENYVETPMKYLLWRLFALCVHRGYLKEICINDYKDSHLYTALSKWAKLRNIEI